MHEESGFESDFQEEEFDTEPTEMFEAKCFTKHGHDILMISNNMSMIHNTPSAVENTHSASITGLNGGQKDQSSNAKNLQMGHTATMNKRAQALFMSREEESNYDGLFKKNQSNYIESVIKF